MNSMALRRSDSQAILSRKAGNSPRRQGAADLANTCSSSKLGLHPQRTPYTTRQGLSRSYDSPEGIHKISQVSTKKSGSRMLRSSASPSASAPQKHINAVSGRNQTILDDAAWMTERIQNLQKTGFSRYPAMSKLRDSAHIAASCGQSLSARNLGHEEFQSSSSLQNQTAITYADEPLSAFRLSEVTLSEEDLLTDLSSTCNSTPVSLQSGHMFDRTAADYYQGNSCSDNAEWMCKDSAPCSKNTSLNIRGDLLHRLEALQHRAGLAVKASHSMKITFNQDSQDLKDHRNGQLLLWSQDSLSSAHDQNEISNPTHSTFESPSWQPVGPSESTCWLQAEVKNQPYVSQLMSSSTRIIRPEYYLPLSKEEEPAQKSVASSCLSSPNYERKLVPKDNNCKRSALRRSSPLCQGRSEDIIPEKGLCSHKQSLPARKSRRSLEMSKDSVNKSAMARGLISATTFTLLEPCAGYNTSINVIQDFLSNEEGGQIQKDLDCEVDYDGEVSWISEENVEGFLHSRCITVDHIDALNTFPEFSDASRGSMSKATVSLLANGKHSQTKDKKPCPYEQSLSSLSGNMNGCLHNKLSKCNKVSRERSGMSDNCKQPSHGSEGSPTIDSRTSSHCQGFLAQSHSISLELDDMQNLLRKPLGQACLIEEGKLHDSDPLVCCKTIPGYKDAIGSQEDARLTMGQPFNQEKNLSFSVLCCEGSENVALEAPSATLETQQQVSMAKMPRSFFSESSRMDNLNTVMAYKSSSLDTTMSSPEVDPIKYQHRPVIAKMCENASPLQGLSEGVASHLEHRNFTKISRSLSFNDKGTNDLEARSNEIMCDDLSELKSKSFSHYWIRNSAYSLDVSELLNNAPRGSKEPDERNFGKILQSSKRQETSSSTGQELLKKAPGIADTDEENGGTHVTLRLPKKSCMTDSEIMTDEVVSPTESKCSQQCHQIQVVDFSAETLYRLHDDSKADKVVKDENCWQKLIVAKEVPKDAGHSEIYDEVNLQKTLSKGIDIGTKVLSHYKNEEACEKCEELTLSEQHVSKALMSYHNNHRLFKGTMNDSSSFEPQVPCSPISQDTEISLSGRVMKTPSILSVYRNPLWLDENSTNFENHHTLQDVEFLDFTYCSERSIGFLDSDKNRPTFSERFENKTWDTYEGIGAFISPPYSPYCTDREKVSEANLLGFANRSDVDSVWDVQSKIEKKLKKSSEEVENCNASVCKMQVVESCLASKDLISCTLSGFDAKLKLTASSDQADQQQLLASLAQASLKSDLARQIALSSNSGEALSIVDDTCNTLSGSSAPLLCSERRLQLKDTSTDYTKVSSYDARMSVSLEDCSCKQLLWQDSTSLIDKNVMIQDVALPARETRDRELLSTSPSKDTTDEAEAGEAVDNHDRKIDQSRQEPCASIMATGVECLYPLDSTSFVNAINKYQSSKDHIFLSNDEMEASEEVKRVTFVHSSSKQSPDKNVNVALPDVPLDSSSTWVFSPVSPVTKGGGNLKNREQKQPLEQDKSQDTRADLNGLGEKVEKLEAEIDKFRRRNKKLKSLVKCMIRKMKQLQQGFRGRKRHGTIRRFMTCLYSVRVQRHRSKASRKS